MINEVLQRQIHTLLDKEAIRSLRLLYSDLLDGGQTDKLGAVFTEDAVLKVTVGAMNGLSEIKAGLAEAYQSFDSLNRGHFPFMHAVTNHQIELTGSDTAKGSCYLIDLVTDRTASAHPVLLLGRYLDKYEKINGEWRIAYSELDVIWPQA